MSATLAHRLFTDEIIFVAGIARRVDADDRPIGKHTFFSFKGRANLDTHTQAYDYISLAKLNFKIKGSHEIEETWIDDGEDSKWIVFDITEVFFEKNMPEWVIDTMVQIRESSYWARERITDRLVNRKFAGKIEDTNLFNVKLDRRLRDFVQYMEDLTKDHYSKPLPLDPDFNFERHYARKIAERVPDGIEFTPYLKNE